MAVEKMLVDEFSPFPLSVRRTWVLFCALRLGGKRFPNLAGSSGHERSYRGANFDAALLSFASIPGGRHLSFCEITFWGEEDRVLLSSVCPLSLLVPARTSTFREMKAIENSELNQGSFSDTVIAWVLLGVLRKALKCKVSGRILSVRRGGPEFHQRDFFLSVCVCVSLLN